MSQKLTPAQVEACVDRLRESIAREECWTCDCLQGLLTQLELDGPEAAEAVEPLKVRRERMHECLGCDPCPPGALFAEFLRRRKQLEEREDIQEETDMSHGPRQAREDTRELVREEYGKIARGVGSCCGPSSCGCGGPSADSVATAAGYSVEELGSLPEGANMGLSCGNPTAIASLKPGDVVLDLGSGGGLDVFIAGARVGAAGRAIGVDMTPEMVTKARRNTEQYRAATNLDNVEFRLGEIEHLPVADATADVVISNCVINLSPDKEQVWREIARVLKPGGRVAVSDLALLRPLPKLIREMVEALVGCVAGAVPVEETERMMIEAGLTDIALERRSDYVEAMSQWHDPLYREILKRLPRGAKPTDYITSLSISARKPVPTGCCKR